MLTFLLLCCVTVMGRAEITGDTAEEVTFKKELEKKVREKEDLSGLSDEELEKLLELLSDPTVEFTDEERRQIRARLLATYIARRKDSSELLVKRFSKTDPPHTIAQAQLAIEDQVVSFRKTTEKPIPSPNRESEPAPLPSSLPAIAPAITTIGKPSSPSTLLSDSFFNNLGSNFSRETPTRSPAGRVIVDENIPKPIPPRVPPSEVVNPISVESVIRQTKNLPTIDPSPPAIVSIDLNFFGTSEEIPELETPVEPPKPRERVYVGYKAPKEVDESGESIAQTMIKNKIIPLQLAMITISAASPKKKPTDFEQMLAFAGMR